MSGMRATCKQVLSPDKAAQAMTQRMPFLRKEVCFASQDAWEEAKHMTPVQNGHHRYPSHPKLEKYEAGIEGP
jgi:hypothetical protein